VSTAADVLSELDRLIGEATTADLPMLIGALEAARAQAWSRIAGPAPNRNGAEPPDENLSATVAARRLGLSKEWMYRHAASLPFTVKIGRRVLFSAKGLDRWNHQRTGR
jgi:predicted DNA-binding transcriptional regulator AlpA